MSKTDWIQTYTGKKFYPLEPNPELICIEDIAHALSNVCRYSGHVLSFYSVAQHSVVLAENFFTDRRAKLVALLHDASEAYLGDISRPLKQLPEFAFYREAEERLQQMIFNKFLGKIGTDTWDQIWWRRTMMDIHKFDTAMIAHEANCLMRPMHPDWPADNTIIPQIQIQPESPTEAENNFLRLYKSL